MRRAASGARVRHLAESERECFEQWLIASQHVEAGTIDPRVDTLFAMARFLGQEQLLVPSWLRPEVIGYIQSAGRLLGQQLSLGAPVVHS